MNQKRQSVIVKHDVINQLRNNDMQLFYLSSSDDSADEDLISHTPNDADEEDAVNVEHESDEEEARKQTKLKRKRRKETKEERDWEFLTKQWFYEAAKQDCLSKTFKSQRACATYYGLSHASLNKYIRNDSCLERTGAALKVRY